MQYRNFTFDEVIELHVMSDFYEQDDDAIKIQDAYLTRLTEDYMDIQVDFNQP